MNINQCIQQANIKILIFNKFLTFVGGTVDNLSTFHFITLIRNSPLAPPPYLPKKVKPQIQTVFN